MPKGYYIHLTILEMHVHWSFYILCLFFSVNMHQDRLCCRKAQRDMDLFYVERNVRISSKYFKMRGKWNTQHKYLMPEYMYILRTEKVITMFQDFVFHIFFFQPCLWRICTVVSLGAIPLGSQGHMAFFFFWFESGILNLTKKKMWNFLSPLYPCRKSLAISQALKWISDAVFW